MNHPSGSRLAARGGAKALSAMRPRPPRRPQRARWGPRRLAPAAAAPAHEPRGAGAARVRGAPITASSTTLCDGCPLAPTFSSSRLFLPPPRCPAADSQACPSRALAQGASTARSPQGVYRERSRSPQRAFQPGAHRERTGQEPRGSAPARSPQGAPQYLTGSARALGRGEGMRHAKEETARHPKK